MLTEQTVQQILSEQAPSILAGMKQEISDAAMRNASHIIEDEIGKHVRKWIQEEVLPGLTAELVENKESLISLGVKAAPLMIDALAEAISAAIKKNLENSWSRKKIFTALLD